MFTLRTRITVRANSLVRLRNYLLSKQSKFGSQNVLKTALNPMSRCYFSSSIRSSNSNSFLNTRNSMKQYRFYSSKFI